MSQNDSHEPVTVTDKRRIDPETGEVREHATGPAPSGPAPEAAAEPRDADAPTRSPSCKSTLQRVKAEYDNYRKRSLREQQARRRSGQGRRRHPTACRCSTISTAPAATATWSRVR